MTDAADGAERRADGEEDPENAYPSDAEETAHDAAQRPDDEVVAVVDSREPEHVAPAVLTHPEVEAFTEHELAAADLVVNGVGFERKTPSDFASSMLEGRMTEQAEKLGDAYDHAYVLLEGSFADFEQLEHTRLKPQSARGMAASLTARYGIPVIPVGDLSMLVDIAVRLGRKHTEAPTSSHLAGGAVGRDEPTGKRLWGVLPDIGPQRADDIHDEYGAPGHFLREHGDDGINKLVEVDGIGTTTARKAFCALFDKEVTDATTEES